jgi:sugar lactone lactonase YvrE
MTGTGRCEIRCDIRCELGEGPLWSARDNAVYWVDILSCAVHRFALTDGHVDTWRLPERVGWVIERDGKPGFIAGLQSGFAELTLEPFAIKHIVDPEPARPDNRLNDAKVDRHGRIWAGSMHCDIAEASGCLYRLDPDFEVSLHDSGYKVTNGPAFTVAHNYMYHTDTSRRRVYRFPLDSDGALGARETFIEFERDWGYPDGMTVDADNGLWIAHWGGGRVSRFTEHGKLDRFIELPASQITSCVFAGPNLDRLFVTSACDGKTDETDAGKLFEVDPGVRGVLQPLFRG